MIIYSLYRYFTLADALLLMPFDLSIVYITLNAEKYLQRSLQFSSRLGDDILVVDSGSVDATHQIVQHAGARLIEQPWLGYAAQKQLAIDHAAHDHLLFLDADEILSEDAVNEIAALLSGEVLADAYSLPRRNWFQGKWIRHSGWWPDRVTRLVNRTTGRMKNVSVHECWETTAEVVPLDAPIEHYSYENYSELVQKADSYSTLAAQQLFEQGKVCGRSAPFWHGLSAFLRTYLLRQGFRDGAEGSAIAATIALASMMKYAKLLELNAMSDQ